MSDQTKCDNLDQRIQEGTEDDEALFEAVAHCLSEEVRRFALSRCGNNRQDIEDISQDALLAAQRYLGSFRGDASLKTWLYRLVLSACSHKRRGRKNDPNIHQELEETSTGPDLANPEMVLMMSERLGALEQAMSELRDEDRQLLAASEWEGLSLQQIADNTGLSVPAIKSRLFRIRRQLRETITARFSPQVGPQQGNPL